MVIGCCNDYEDEKQSCWGKGSKHESFPKCQITLYSSLLCAKNFREIWLKKVNRESKHDRNWQIHLSRSTVVLLFIYIFNDFIPLGTGGIHWQRCYFDHLVTVTTRLKCKLLWKPTKVYLFYSGGSECIEHCTPDTNPAVYKKQKCLFSFLDTRDIAVFVHTFKACCFSCYAWQHLIVIQMHETM